MRTGQWNGEFVLSTKNGNQINVDSSWTLVRDEDGQAKSVLVIHTDITERKRTEEQLLRAQRIESIGSLAGGIAHDLNNILSPIMMSLEVLRLKYTDEESQIWLRILHESAERGAGMIRQVLSFARGSEGKRVHLQPQHIIKDFIRILKETFPKSIEVQFDLPKNLWAITGDPTQLYQVLMNLCMNSRDAMPNGGSIIIAAENQSVDETFARMNPEAHAGDFVRISVTDTGTGIDAKTMSRIFEPFFTTREVGEGTGLGLSMVLTIVKSHGGFVDVHSETGRSTQMSVYLPASRVAGENPLRERVGDLPTGHGDLVLVVDDEDSIRQITKSTLETFGYRVLLARDGTEAIAMYVANRADVKVVLTDMMMPFMDGLAMIRALKKLAPSIKIICASGLTDDPKIVEAGRAGVQFFLSKPYTAGRLLKALAEVLAS